MEDCLLTSERESMEFVVWLIVIVGLLIPVALWCWLWNRGGDNREMDS